MTEGLPIVAQGWQPIETAPRDGTEVLVCVTHNLPDDEWETIIWTDNYHDEGWFRWSDRIDIPFPPTHWMPLPAPPGTRPPQTIIAGSGEEIVGKDERLCPACGTAIWVRVTGRPDDLVSCQCTTVSAEWLTRAARHLTNPDADFIEAQQARERGLVEALESARAVVKLDADACRAFAGEGEPVELEEVLSIIDHALSTASPEHQQKGTSHD